jgi:uncharacterized protein YbbC (DUF1343 family)
MKLLSLAPVLVAIAAPVALEAEVRLGNEVLAEHSFQELNGKRVGLITNPSGVNRNLKSTIDLLRAAPGVKLVALFGPEHGIYGDVPAGDKVASRTDARTGLPAHSLYGATRKPTPGMLKGLDALVYDLQDTGCRSYTYISTMGLAMEACGQAGVEFVVLDRPNPLGGERVEGPMVEEKFRSFVSRWDVPYVYGLTCGEMARMITGEHWITNLCKLTVVPMNGWSRGMVWCDTGLPWVPTSPHVPHGESPLFQVATGMLGEIGGVSTGIGYTLPFECVALPGLEPRKLAEALNGCQLPGVKFQPITYKPYYSTFKDQAIGGVQVYFTEPGLAPLTPINFYALEALKKLTGRDLFLKAGKNQAVSRRHDKGASALTAVRLGLPKPKDPFEMFDKVNGTDATRKALQAGTPAAQIVASWKAGEGAFREKRKKYLLY